MYKTTVPTIITNGHFNKEKTLAELKRCGAERIALALDRETDYAFSSPENLELLKELVRFYRSNGLEVLVWLGETFGHDGGSQPNKGKYTSIRFIDKGDIKAFCPLDENFLSDFCKWVEDVAECAPDMIMLDDDFRLGHRGGLGCCCDRHMKRLESVLGEKLNAEELKTYLFDGGKNKYRDAWLRVQRESMESFAAALRKALDKVNPKIRLGFCCAPSSWDAEGWNAANVARIMAGGTKPFLRTSAAPYWVVNWMPGKLGRIAEIERSQFGRLPGGEIFSEGDTYPRPRTECPSAYLECFDMIMRADGRSDGILKYMLDYVSDADYETGYADAMVKNAGLYREIDRLFGDKSFVGVRPYNHVEIIENAVYDASRPDILNEIQDSDYYASLEFAVLNSLPTAYADGFVNIVFGEHARYIPEDALKNGSVIDITAAKILMSRGIDVGISKFEPNCTYEQRGFTDLPQKYHVDEGIYTRLSGGVEVENLSRKNNTHLLSEYRYPNCTTDGEFKYENSDGMRFLVYPFDAAAAKRAGTWLFSYAGRRSLIKSLMWLGKGLRVYPAGNYPMLYIMTKENENALAVGLWNLFDDKIESAEIKVEKAFSDVRFVNCKGHAENGTIVLDSTLYPYEFAGFELI